MSFRAKRLKYSMAGENSQASRYYQRAGPSQPAAEQHGKGYQQRPHQRDAQAGGVVAVAQHEEYRGVGLELERPVHHRVVLVAPLHQFNGFRQFNG